MRKNAIFLFLAIVVSCGVFDVMAGVQEMDCHVFDKKFTIQASFNKAWNTTNLRLAYNHIYGRSIVTEETILGYVEVHVVPSLFDVTYDGIVLSRQIERNQIELAAFKPTEKELEVVFPWRRFPGGKIFVQDREALLFNGVRFSIFSLNEEGYLELVTPFMAIFGEDVAVKDTLLRFSISFEGDIKISSRNLSDGTLRIKKDGDLLLIREDLDEQVEKVEFFADNPRKKESDLCEAPLPNIRKNFKNEPGLKMAIEIGMKTIIIPLEVTD